MSKKSMLTAILTIALLSSFLFVASCKKTNDITESSQEEIETPVPESDYNESNEDLFSVNYQEIYDELADHGEWLQVSADDIGLNKESSAFKTNESNGSSSLVKKFFFIEDAYASADVDLGLFFVWRPSPNIAVGLAAGTATLAPIYVPYTNGQWVYTDAGYYFQAYTPYEEIVHHYGRWVFHPIYGWVWVPGRVWAPAWVTWYESGPYIAWAPIPPGVYLTSNVLVPPPIDYVNFVVVERRYFFEPRIYTYYYRYPIDPVVIVPTMYSVSGVTVVNNTIINAGPDFVKIKSVYGKPINMVHIKKVHSKGDVKYGPKDFHVYTPTFTKVKFSDKRKITVTQPKRFAGEEAAREYEVRKRQKQREEERCTQV
jgi:hypothetical protein